MDSSPVSVIETCWPAIEPFVDLEGSVSVSQTCTTLHRLIIDSHTRQIKVSHFEVDNTPLSDQGEEKSWQTAPGRIPHFLSRALNAIHFPSLRSIAIDFPATRRRIATGHADEIDDASSSAFPIFVANLSYARNLETLHFCAGRLMATERSGKLESLYELFAENLGRCDNLAYMTIANLGFVRGNPEPLYSVALARAMTDVIRKRRLGLESVKIHTAGQPSDPTYNTLLRSRGIDAMKELFTTVFSASSVKELMLSFQGGGSWQHWNTLLDVAKICREAMPDLRRLMLGYDYCSSEMGTSELQPHGPIFDLFSKSHSLEYLWMGMSRRCMQEKETILSLRRLLENKTNLEYVSIDFGSAYDEDGDIVKALSETLAPNIDRGTQCYLSMGAGAREEKILSHVCIENLRGVVKEDVSNLHMMLDSGIMVCNDFIAEKNGDRRLDIDEMTYFWGSTAGESPKRRTIELGLSN
ncbi:hypothetical protein ACHAXT_005466 [Thalassiosira profunda]